MSYSPTLGRFLQTDLEVYVDGPNVYQAERSNPINMVDPMGLATTGNANGRVVPLPAQAGPVIKITLDGRLEENEYALSIRSLAATVNFAVWPMPGEKALNGAIIQHCWFGYKQMDANGSTLAEGTSKEWWEAWPVRNNIPLTVRKGGVLGGRATDKIEIQEDVLLYKFKGKGCRGWYTAYFEMRFVPDYDPSKDRGWITPTSDKQTDNQITATDGRAQPVGFVYARATKPDAWDKGGPVSYHKVSWEWDYTVTPPTLEHIHGEGYVH